MGMCETRGQARKRAEMLVDAYFIVVLVLDTLIYVPASLQQAEDVCP